MSNISLSSLNSGLGVVSNLSPANIEPAPAKKHNACASIDIFVLPADNLTTDSGKAILVVATIRINSHCSIGFCCSNGVPSIATNALIGIESGGVSISM